MKNQCLTYYVALMAFLSATLSSCSKPAPFSTELFQSIDGQQAIKFISGDELELRGEVGNFVCKYAKQGNTLRVTKNVLGTPFALYFDIIPEGLRQNDGTIFYSPTGLASKREELRQQSDAEQRKRREQEQHVAALRAESHKESRVIAVVKVVDSTTWSLEPAGEATVTDVSFKIRQRLGRESINRVHWFGDITRVPEYSRPNELVFDYYGTGTGEQHIFTVDERSGAELKAAFNSALRAWRQKYAQVLERDLNR